ncbi:hypothetical protein XAC3810_1280011 [Xanthomonas citri pv. citri]|uniref:Uncharacterized protein n=1 Tax=Xanthomonas citri pv. citri TaxID=611301 RepID=A0A0U5G5K1_XANCI|nr:hypothetical protein XAC3810_1280011 [Xanthomonas citri pv. citri]CEJ49062.1 hypothetical protein XAB3213_4840002 [Xanthomonas citri pv. bilvae]CEE55399.1 hypothetical protein XACW160_1470010 [Xanthomonas citri pv. citri]CEE56536.1 hypothetical protein XAC2852_1270024 [Xanthomonas citri pv. citri]CEE80097.1 hypothetical protein XACLE20_1940010 [Xanthomonas citri pv. citri]
MDTRSDRQRGRHRTGQRQRSALSQSTAPAADVRGLPKPTPGRRRRPGLRDRYSRRSIASVPR